MKKAILILLAILLGGSLFVWSGVYNFAATDEHWAITTRLIEYARERSIEVRAKDIAVPDYLDDSARIAAGGANFEEMCASCHLAPDGEVTELYEGLYPLPPVFYKSTSSSDDEHSREHFWVIKNGLKLTSMPAWGVSHSDDEIWAMVAFINKLGGMSAEEYQDMTADGEAGGHDDAQDDGHDDGEDDGHDDGQDDGHDDGQDDGHDDGQDDGHDNG
jgi:mono/diheme cytochrome c family protein